MGQVMNRMGVGRLLGIVISFVAMMWGAMNFPRVHEQRGSLLFDASVWLGLVLGNYFYAHLWLAEGRDRERRSQGARREPRDRESAGEEHGDG